MLGASRFDCVLVLLHMFLTRPRFGNQILGCKTLLRLSLTYWVKGDCN